MNFRHMLLCYALVALFATVLFGASGFSEDGNMLHQILSILFAIILTVLLWGIVFGQQEEEDHYGIRNRNT